MITLPIRDVQGAEVGSYELDPADFASHVNKQLLHDAVVMYQANQRMGSAKTKTRSEVAGSNKKVYRQKGTGNARAGSRRSGIRRGGGHIHAIRPRDYSYRLPRKALQLATRMAIASRIRDDEIVVIDDLALDRPHTQEMSLILKALGLSGTSTLVATEKHDNHVYLSGRNISQITISPVGDLNALLVLKPQKMLVTKAALDAIQEKAKEAKSQKSE